MPSSPAPLSWRRPRVVVFRLPAVQDRQRHPRHPARFRSLAMWLWFSGKYIIEMTETPPCPDLNGLASIRLASQYLAILLPLALLMPDSQPVNDDGCPGPGVGNIVRELITAGKTIILPRSPFTYTGISWHLYSKPVTPFRNSPTRKRITHFDCFRYLNFGSGPGQWAPTSSGRIFWTSPRMGTVNSWPTRLRLYCAAVSPAQAFQKVVCLSLSSMWTGYNDSPQAEVTSRPSSSARRQNRVIIASSLPAPDTLRNEAPTARDSDLPRAPDTVDGAGFLSPTSILDQSPPISISIYRILTQ